MKLPHYWKLPASIKNRFGQKSAGKQRAMLADGHLLLVLHKAPNLRERTRQSVLFWRKPEGAWENSRGGMGLQPLINHIHEYQQAEETFSAAYEQAQDAEDYFRLLENIAPLRLATKNLHAALQAAREGISSDRDMIDLRDWAYEIERALDLLYENTKNALDFNIAKRTEEQVRLSLESVEAGNRLNVLAAVFFPLTAISCVFGMNLASGLEGSPSLAFWGISGTAITVGLIVRRWVVTGRWY